MDERGKKYMVTDQEFHTDFGFITEKDIVESEAGDMLKTHLGREFKVIKPNVNDYIELMERKCSIILPKDIGIITAKTGLGSGFKVLDAGTGAGATALHFGNIVGNSGEVVTHMKFEKTLQKLQNVILKDLNLKMFMLSVRM